MQTLIATKTIPADGMGTASYRYTLSLGQGPQPYATHMQNMEYGEGRGKAWGHYFETIHDALSDLEQRIRADHHSAQLLPVFDAREA